MQKVSFIIAALIFSLFSFTACENAVEVTQEGDADAVTSEQFPNGFEIISGTLYPTDQYWTYRRNQSQGVNEVTMSVHWGTYDIKCPGLAGVRYTVSANTPTGTVSKVLTGMLTFPTNEVTRFKWTNSAVTSGTTGACDWLDGTYTNFVGKIEVLSIYPPYPMKQNGSGLAPAETGTETTYYVYRTFQYNRSGSFVSSDTYFNDYYDDADYGIRLCEGIDDIGDWETD